MKLGLQLASLLLAVASARSALSDGTNVWRSLTGVPVDGCRATLSNGGNLRVECPEANGWTFGLELVQSKGVEYATVRLKRAGAAVPPVFKIEFDADGAGVRNVWTPSSERCMPRPDGWGDYPYVSSLAEHAPIASAFGNDENRLTAAVSEALRKVDYALVVNANTCRLTGRFRFFSQPEAPLADYAVTLRIDRRRGFWAQSVADASAWISDRAGLKPCPIPAPAYDPVYSSWYAFDQDVWADALEGETKAAAALGMKTAILDDGWQKSVSRTFYSGTGDWMPVAMRFRDMKGHVDKVHANGLRYLLWIALPLVGDESAAWNRFRDKFLFVHRGGTAVLDPRFPEVREHLCRVCERAVREWGFDGLKIDFIDQFSFCCTDPDTAESSGPIVDRAIAENYAGRDIRSLPLAVDRLMSDVYARLVAIKPDALVEFRQYYMGPAIRQYGNMIRGLDCPDDLNKNRKQICDLRLTSGDTAVHADMLVWSVNESVEGAAQSVLSALFGTVQYSMRLANLPETHKTMVRHWIAFSQRHRETLLKGTFRPHHPELGYPAVEAESADERIVAVYAAGQSVGLRGGKREIVINATAAPSVIVSCESAGATFALYDTLGRKVGERKLEPGCHELPIPPSGYATTLCPAAEPSSLLPAESKEHPALAPDPFPDRISAYVWRNWGLVPAARLAEVVGATAADLTALAADFGLKPNPEVLPEWRRKGYITIVRRNWHLLTCAQIARLVEMTDEEFAFSLKEDDFLFGKLGGFKPGCTPLVWNAEEVARTRSARREIARIVREEGIDPNAAEEPRFSFIREISTPSNVSRVKDSAVHLHPSPSPSSSLHMIASYFADYGDPLGNDEISSFPEGLLQKLAANGVNAVWMHVVLNQLTMDPKYPEFGKGSARRVANLKKLVARAAKYGIKVYLYMNEPRCVSTSFFANHKDIQGVCEDSGVSAMCTSSPETRRWLRDALQQLFSNVKGLGGVFTITMSENLTNCASHGQKTKCPRCKDRSVADILAEVHATIAEGVRAGDPSAEVLAWNWQWPTADEASIVAKLPKTGCRVMGVSENGIPVTIGGVTIPEADYSIAIVGPGENARRLWGAARARGLPCVAKVQANNSWELSSFPYLPLADLVWEHAENLRREGVSGVMLSWSCGSAPAPNLRLFDGVSPEALATDLYGAKAVPAVRRAWKAFADGFRRYPFEVVVLYKGPQQWGPANPLYAKPTGYEATMVGIPYDGLDFGSWDNKWHGRFPLKDWLARFEEVADGFEKGSRLFDEALPLVVPEKRAAAEKESRMFRAEAMHFRSVVDQSRFILARDAGDRDGMRKYAQRELDAAKAYLPILRGDSRIGYECSNHYYYIPRDVIEKIVGCRLILDELDSRR